MVSSYQLIRINYLLTWTIGNGSVTHITNVLIMFKGGLHPYPGVAETLVTKVFHWRSIPITGDQIAIYYM